ncbi:MAG: hypothetical protein NTZ95_08435 [Candidatus Omnitrophica bacterium]|nr:hypothetical protein [Candidatus Omnitrophota bacterium]
MLKILILMVAILIASIPVYAEDAQVGKDDFVSGAITDMFNKIGQYTSGEKSIIIEDYASQTDTGKPIEPKPKDGKAPVAGAHW